MKTFLPAVIALIVLQAVGSVQEDSKYPEDALLVSNTVQEYLERESMVNFEGADSSLVLLVALGGEWTGESDQWTEMIIITSYAASLDLQRSWNIMDIAVSFGSSWCSISMENIFETAAEELSETEFLEQFKAITEIHPMN
ncbi:MAG: hypothetical protein K8R76_04645 [Candidatus Aegiribacteria sp.]|nr:hypothetical protein [Candidatus Aegiribacteria sp.]